MDEYHGRRRLLEYLRKGGAVCHGFTCSDFTENPFRLAIAAEDFCEILHRCSGSSLLAAAGHSLRHPARPVPLSVGGVVVGGVVLPRDPVRSGLSHLPRVPFASLLLVFLYCIAGV
eukprot:6703054-Prymnesium_polylepis.1